MRKDIRTVIGKEYLVLDGGFGSMLQKYEVATGDASLNITNPEIVTRIHSEYLDAGSMVITMNTFGCDKFHLTGDFELEAIIKAAYDNALNAISRTNRDAYILYDMASTGKLLKPLGDLGFEEAVEAFAEQVRIARDYVDGFIIETMSDLYEMKAAILAVKENTDLPIIASATFTDSLKMLTGASPLQMLTVVEGLGVDMVGINCSLGPNELLPIVEEILANSTLPLLVQPNAGLPKFDGKKTYYDVSADDFSLVMSKMIDMGISGFGGCCGTTPEYIRKTVEALGDRKLSFEPKPSVTRVTGTMTCVQIDKKIVVCGERLNPTGKPKMKAAILEGNYEYLVDEALKQIENGAHVLDVNVGLPGIDEAEVLENLILLLQEVVDCPLQIDSTNPKALERACRIYNGVPLINSVNGKEEVLRDILPIVKKYGGVVLGLCLDENGIPSSSKDRFEIAKRIVSEAANYGIKKERIIIDALVLTASAQQKEVLDTLKCVGLVTNELGLGTCLGLSNVSFGLPNRPLINKTFLCLAMQEGLKMPILNPLDRELMSAIDAFEVLHNLDEGSIAYIEKHKDDIVSTSNATKSAASSDATSSSSSTDSLEGSDLYRAIVKGQKNKALDAVSKLDEQPLAIVEGHIIPALDKVGKDYDAQKLFLPQLMMSAESAKLVFDKIKDKIVTDSSATKGPVLIATVEADVHDIGKNIVKVVLQSYGFEVIDLGKDVKASVIVDSVKQHKPIAVGLSALMTTTVPYMQQTIEALKDAKLDVPVIVGGAVLSQDVCDKIGGSFYGKDAMETVRICETLV